MCLIYMFRHDKDTKKKQSFKRNGSYLFMYVGVTDFTGNKKDR